MKTNSLFPISIITLIALVGCASGPSAACIKIDQEVRELQEKADKYPSFMENVKEYRLTRVNELYDFCLSNPPQFLKNREYWTSFGGEKVPSDTCSSWRMWAGYELADEIDSEIGKLQREMNDIQFKASTLIRKNQECFDENGFLK